MSNSAMVDQKGRLKIPRDPPSRAQEGSDTEFYITSEDGSSFAEQWPHEVWGENREGNTRERYNSEISAVAEALLTGNG